MEQNVFMGMDDMDLRMDSEDLNPCMLDGTYNPFLTTSMNGQMNLIQQQMQQMQTQTPGRMQHPIQNFQQMQPQSNHMQQGGHIQDVQMHNQLRGHISPAHMSNQMQDAQLRGQIAVGEMSGQMQDVQMQSPAHSSLFQAYAAQFGMNKAQQQPMNVVTAPIVNSSPEQGDDTVEAYAALMGIKLESPRNNAQNQSFSPGVARAQMNAQYFESLLKMQGGNMGQGNVTSMTLPAGVGSGCGNNFADAMATPLVRTGGSPTAAFEAAQRIKSESANAKPPLHVQTGALGSQTLPPEALSLMIQNNLQNSADVTSQSYGSASWNACKLAALDDYKLPDVLIHYCQNQLILVMWKKTLFLRLTKGMISLLFHVIFNNTNYFVNICSRERNRDHSRKSRLRKKVFVEGLKQEVCLMYPTSNISIVLIMNCIGKTITNL